MYACTKCKIKTVHNILELFCFTGIPHSISIVTSVNPY